MAALSSIIFGMLAMAGSTRAEPVRVESTQITIERRVIIKVPVRSSPVAEKPVQWVEKGSAKCVDVDSIAGAWVTSPSAVDLILKGGERWRLKFRDECPMISFYRGFYLRPGNDRRLCAKRDVLRVRSGSECEIRAFRKLVPQNEE